MAKAPLDPEIGELTELLDLKRKITKINDQIHDKAASIAIKKLEQMHPNYTFRVKKAHEPGFDIEGFANPQCSGKSIVIAEVKTISVTPPNKYLSNKQMEVVREDLERLKSAELVEGKYLVVLTEEIKDDIHREFDFDGM